MAIEDDDCNVDKDMFLARLKIARKKLKAKDFNAAETRFDACLSEEELVKSLPQHEVVDLKLELATACRRAGNQERYQSVLFDLLKLGVEKHQEFHLMYTLAVAYLEDSQLEMARTYAEDAMKGRKKLFKRRHEFYHESLYLVVLICRAQDHNDAADTYQYLLPPIIMK